MNNAPAVVVAGDPIDGILIYGPFPYIEDAIRWAEGHIGGAGDDWWAVPLESIEDEEE